MIRVAIMVFALLMFACESSKEKLDTPSSETRVSSDSLLTPEYIVQQSRIFHGSDKIDDAAITFKFRDYNYEYLKTDSGLVRTRSTLDSMGREVKDRWFSKKLVRTIDGVREEISEAREKAYMSSINSVFYFSFLPKSLLDPAVNLVYIDTVVLNERKYHKIQVTFDQEGGGDDYEDVFLYWFDVEDFSMDYLAYSYMTEGGGMRFRSVINSQKIEGIVFQDYANFAPPENASFMELDQLYSQGELKQVSTIEQDSISVKF